jgi:hypothetical protein
MFKKYIQELLKNLKNQRGCKEGFVERCGDDTVVRAGSHNQRG